MIDISSKEFAIERIAEYMEVSAVTAPKAKGMDSLISRTLTGSEIEEIGNKMVEIGKESGDEGFVRDGKNVLESDALLIIGIKEHEGIGLDCGGCGFKECEEFNESKKIDVEFQGPNCIYKILDLGIALGSAVKTAAIHNADSRIMYRVGVAAREMDTVDGTVIIGVPIAGKPKSPYFDR